MELRTIFFTILCTNGIEMRSIPPGKKSPKSNTSGIPIRHASMAPKQGMMSTSGSSVTCNSALICSWRSVIGKRRPKKYTETMISQSDAHVSSTSKIVFSMCEL